MTMTTTESTSRSATGRFRGVLLSTLVGGAIASIANAIVAFAGLAAGADPALPGLTPAAFITFTVAGILIGAIGWALIRRTRAAKRILAVLVPVVLALSLIPDIAIAGTGTSAATTAGITLGVMHLVTVAVAIPVYRTFLPLAR
jgi:hypothetical protein